MCTPQLKAPFGLLVQEGNTSSLMNILALRLLKFELSIADNAVQPGIPFSAWLKFRCLQLTLSMSNTHEQIFWSATNCRQLTMSSHLDARDGQMMIKVCACKTGLWLSPMHELRSNAAVE